uniref:helix-turn-helix domain-containing protein n=1 Tax=Corallococcus coralloides TaxID=184914 RepID=UPI00196AB55D
MASGSGRLLTVREVAERMGVCWASAYRLCKQGILPHIRFSNAVRIKKEDAMNQLLRDSTERVGKGHKGRPEAVSSLQEWDRCSRAGPLQWGSGLATEGGCLQGTQQAVADAALVVFSLDAHRCRESIL